MMRMHITEHRLTARQVPSIFVLELYQIPPKPQVNIVIYGDTARHIVVAEVVDREVCWKGIGVRQHARAESFSKRAPSTTRTSLHWRWGPTPSAN
jgi:hypothetical protein